MKQEHIDFLIQLQDRLKTQDNRYTAYPIFEVREIERSIDFTSDSGFPAICIDGDILSFEDDGADAIIKALEFNYDITNLDTSSEFLFDAIEDWIDESGCVDGQVFTCYYRDIEKTVISCFTEQGAKDYIESNGHNLKKPFIYAASNFRNDEMNTLREILMTTDWDETI